MIERKTNRRQSFVFCSISPRAELVVVVDGFVPVVEPDGPEEPPVDRVDVLDVVDVDVDDDVDDDDDDVDDDDRVVVDVLLDDENVLVLVVAFAIFDKQSRFGLTLIASFNSLKIVKLLHFSL